MNLYRHFGIHVAAFAVAGSLALIVPAAQASPPATSVPPAVPEIRAPDGETAEEAYDRAAALLGDMLPPGMLRADYDRIMHIQKNSRDGKSVLPNDVKFLLRYFASHESNTQADLLPGSLAIDCLQNIVTTSANTTRPSAKLSTELEGRIYDTIAPYVRRSNEGSYDLSDGMMILGYLGNRKAVPLILPYTHSADRNLKIIAYYALKDLGYLSAVPKDLQGLPASAPAHRP